MTIKNYSAKLSDPIFQASDVGVTYLVPTPVEGEIFTKGVTGTTEITITGVDTFTFSEDYISPVTPVNCGFVEMYGILTFTDSPRNVQFFGNPDNGLLPSPLGGVYISSLNSGSVVYNYSDWTTGPTFEQVCYLFPVGSSIRVTDYSDPQPQVGYSKITKITWNANIAAFFYSYFTDYWPYVPPKNNLDITKYSCEIYPGGMEWREPIVSRPVSRSFCLPKNTLSLNELPSLSWVLPTASEQRYIQDLNNNPRAFISCYVNITGPWPRHSLYWTVLSETDFEIYKIQTGNDSLKPYLRSVEHFSEGGDTVTRTRFDLDFY